LRPIFHWTAARVRAHVMLCMLAYHVEHHMRAKLAPMLYDDTDHQAAAAMRTSIVAKGEHHMGGPRVTIDHRTVVLDEHGNEVKPGSGVRGVIAKKGNIPVGYYKDEKKTAETFKTFNGVRYAIPGDYAEVEEDGSVTMLGRGSVSINSGGEKIYPEEVEAALKGHPDVFDALVVGVPDPRFGQHVAAVVQPREGAQPTLAELDAFVRSEIAGYKVPRSLWFVDEVKRSPAGKPDYRWAKDQTEERPADDVHANHVGTPT